MRKIFLAALFFLASSTSVFALNVTTHSSLQLSCDGGTFPPIVLYGGTTGHLWDRIDTSLEGIISGNSEVSVYIRGNKMTIPNGWTQVSTYMPGAGSYYAVWNNQLAGLNLANLVPSDRDTPVAQIVYRIRRMHTGGNNSFNFSGDYRYANFTGANPVLVNLGNLNRRFDPSTLIMDNECVSIVPRWCWDGVLDTPQGEVCDLGPQNGQPGSPCTSTCTPTPPVSVTPTCSNLTATPTAGTIPLTVSFTGIGANLGPSPAYRIVIRDSATNAILTTINGATGNYTFTTAGSYTAQLFIDTTVNGQAFANLTSVACTSGISATPGGGGSPSCVRGSMTIPPTAPVTLATPGLCPAGQTPGNLTSSAAGNTTNYAWSCDGTFGGSCLASYTPSGGGSPSCVRGSMTIPPTAPVTLATPGLCPAGQTPGNLNSSTVGNTTNYTWSCNGNFGGSCLASYTSVGGGWVPPGRPVTTPGSFTYCGDHVVQRPNSQGQMETCDNPEPWCINCTVGSTQPWSRWPGTFTITNPGTRGPIGLSDYRIIAGNGVNLFTADDVISFTTSYPIFIDNKTATVSNRSNLISGSSVSKLVNTWVGGSIDYESGREYDASGSLVRINYSTVTYPTSIELFAGSELSDFRGNTSSFQSDANISYRDTRIASYPSQVAESFYVNLQYLESSIPVRVSKPIISNTAWGNAYINNPAWYDVNVIADNFINTLKTGNFTTASINAGSRSLSSRTQTVVNNSTINERIQSDSMQETGGIDQFSHGTAPLSFLATRILSSGELLTKGESLGDNGNVRIFKKWNLSLDADITLSGVKTIIVEEGNLLLNGNVRYADATSSYAFIVKKGNVIVNNTLTSLAGVYIVLGPEGKIHSDGVHTTNKLVVDGSLYGDTGELSEKRTYVRGTNAYTALDAWIILNYSNRAFKSTPPLLTQFLEQYSLQKVAK